MRELKLRPFNGKFSTNRLPMTVLTDASEVLSSGALPSTVTLSVVLPMDNVKSSVARWSTSRTIAVLMDGFESGGFDGDVIRAGRQRRDAVQPLLVRVTRRLRRFRGFGL